MKYKLTTRLLTTDEASMEFHHSAEENVDVDMYLSSLAEDIRSITTIKSVARTDGVFLIEVEDEMSQLALKSAMKPFFSGARFSAYRFVSLDPS